MSYQTPPHYSPPIAKPVGLAVTALVVGIVAFLTGLIPILGILLGLTGVVFGVLALVKRQSKGMSITGLCLASVAAVVSLFSTVGMFALVGQAPNVATSPAPSAEAPAELTEATPTEPKAKEELGLTRDSPLPLGSTLESGAWQVTINSVELDATQSVLEGNMFNDEPAEGHQYAMVNVTAKYLGADAEGDYPSLVVQYVTSEGNTITQSDSFALPPEAFDLSETLYEGASASGNIALMVPTDGAADGVLAVKAEAFADKRFVSVQ